MITAIIVGAGHRSMMYAKLSKYSPDKLKIVGVADPNEVRRKMVMKEYGLSPEQCFTSAEELASKGKLADAVINGTMDNQHVKTTIPLLEAGYDVLLEKPFAVTESEIYELDAVVKRTGRKVMVCHVLRYAPFYAEMKKRILNGEIGEIISIQTAEHVSYHHIASCYVRGKWRREDFCGSSILMAKCCHDLDLLAWFLSGIKPAKIASFGGRHYFTREKAPANSGEYCLLDCPIEKDCLYSARKHYLEHPERWSSYVWAGIEHIENQTDKTREAFLKDRSNPYGKCVWKLDNDVLDRQAVMVEFANGAIATHNLIGGTSRPMRKIHIIGTTGELDGILDENKYYLRKIDPRKGHEYSETEYNLTDEGDTTGAFGGHGGGDSRLAIDFVSVLEGNEPSISCTSLSDSINGHLIGFAAGKALEQNKIVTL